MEPGAWRELLGEELLRACQWSVVRFAHAKVLKVSMTGLKELKTRKISFNYPVSTKMGITFTPVLSSR